MVRLRMGMITNRGMLEIRRAILKKLLLRLEGSGARPSETGESVSTDSMAGLPPESPGDGVASAKAPQPANTPSRPSAIP
jgi:hypothetical protein